MSTDLEQWKRIGRGGAPPPEGVESTRLSVATTEDMRTASVRLHEKPAQSDVRTPLTPDERLAAVERGLREVRLALGLELPSTPEEMRARGVVGVITDRGAARPNQRLEEIPAIASLIEAQTQSQLPDLTPEEALAHYGSPGVPMLFPEALRFLDASDHRWIAWPRGWHRVPEKHVAALEHRQVMKIPPEMLHAE